ncbi:MAG TPA: hypothetical protein PLB55_11515 [Prosthecobacter sp.]|nr:hypothetical protein [Prosthecobacter sp.]
MNREEARLELDATTLRPQDASSEARAMLEGDAELAAWHAKRTAFDESVAEAFAAAIPAGLRESILQNAKRPAKRPVRWMMPALISAAAACIAGAWLLLWPVNGEMPAWQAESLAAVVQVEHGMMKLDDRAPDLEAVKKLLAATSSPSPQRLPGTLGGLPTFGCKRIRIAGRPATIICFKIEGGEAHLVVMDNARLNSAPPQMKPQFQTSKNWHMATWSDGSQTFLLATSASEQALKKLFGLT